MNPLSVMSTELFTAPGPNPGALQGINKQLGYRTTEEWSQDSTPDLHAAVLLLNLCDELPQKSEDPSRHGDPNHLLHPPGP